MKRIPIKETDSILAVAETYPELRASFDANGLGGYFSEESLERIGRFARLGTILKTAGIDPAPFIEDLNQHLTAIEESRPGYTVEQAAELHFMSMLPCGLRNPFVKAFEEYQANHSDAFSDFNFLNEGNFIHEVSFYPLVDGIESAVELPDVIMASDVNHYFHRPFYEKFIETGTFEDPTPYAPHDYLKECGYYDPAGNFTMYTANMLVMVVDHERLNGRTAPTCWDGLLSPEFENDIIIRGGEGFFCNAVLLPYYKAHGIEAIRTFAKNIKTGHHPAEMVKLAGSGKEEAAAVYVMPFFFAKKICKPQVKIVWPEDGAIASPVFMLVKKGAKEKHPALFEFLFSKETSEMMARGHFTPVHPEAETSLSPKVKWLGWEFLSAQTVGDIKEAIGKTVEECRSTATKNSDN